MKKLLTFDGVDARLESRSQAFILSTLMKRREQAQGLPRLCPVPVPDLVSCAHLLAVIELNKCAKALSRLSAFM